MIVKLEGKLERGFAPWKAMLEGASDKLKEHGMTVIYAGTSIADDNSLTVIIDFASGRNDEFRKRRRGQGRKSRSWSFIGYDCDDSNDG